MFHFYTAWKRLVSNITIPKQFVKKLTFSVYQLNSFDINIPFLCRQKNSENIWFYEFCWGIELEHWRKMG